MRRSPKHRAQPGPRPGGPQASSARAVASTAASLAVALAPSLLGGAPAQATLATAVTAGYPQRVAQIGVTIVTLQTKDKSAADAAALDVNAYRNAVASASSYWSAMSAGRISLRVTRVVPGFKTSASSGDDFTTIMTTVSRELGWAAGSSTVLLIAVPRDDVVVSGKGGNLGAGWEAGQTSGRILLPRQSSFTGSVTAHEMGHVLGIGHANTLQCSDGAPDTALAANHFSDSTCSTRVYGDRTDIMGLSQVSQPQLNAYLFEYGGMGRGDEIANTGTAGAPATYTLTPWAGGAPRRAAKFQDPATGEWYYLQYKAPIGYDASTALNGNKGVEILKGGLDETESLLIPPSTRPFPGYYADSLAWQPGQTFTTVGGTHVTVNSVNASSATVTIASDRVVTPQIASQIDAKAATANLGAPLGGIGPSRDGGFYRNYQRGSVIWTTSTGARLSAGAIRSVWQRLGFENGTLGYPTTDVVAGLKGGGMYQNYQGGAIVWSPATGAFESTGAIRVAWQRLGFEGGALGYPTTGVVTGLKNGGMYQNYQGGAIVWSPAHGAFESRGAIRAAWQGLGFEGGKLGYPTSDEYAISGGVAQNFEGGRIEWNSSSGAKVVASVGGAGGTVTPIATTPAPAPKPSPSPAPPPAANPETSAQIQAMVRQTAVQMGVDPALALAVAEQESGFRQNVTSPVGAIGVMQIMPANRDWLAGMTGRPSLDLNKTADNIAAGIAMLRWLRAEANNLDEAIAGYYQGLGSVQSRGMYDDTKAYVAQVKARMARF